jgi:hypothetical protein
MPHVDHVLLFASSQAHKIISLGSSKADAHQLIELIIEVNRTTRCAEPKLITRFGIEYDLQHLITTFFCYYTKTTQQSPIRRGAMGEVVPTAHPSST